MVEYDRTFEKWQQNLPPEILRATYDRIGWDSWRGIIRTDLVTLVREAERPRILDVGCFVGDYLQVLLNEDLEFEYTGLDVTPRYVEYATKRFASLKERLNGRQRYDFQEGTVFSLPFDSGKFDIVLFAGVLIHLPEVDKPLEEIFRVSRGKSILGVDIHSESEDEIITIKNGFLYKTWSQEYIFGKIGERATIDKASFRDSPHYNYKHCSVIAVKKEAA